MKQQDPFEKNPWFIKSLDRIYGYLTLKETVIVVMATLYLMIFSIIAYLFTRRRPVFLFFSVILSIAMVTHIVPVIRKINRLKDDAIVISRIRDARYEPIEDADVHFPLYEGMKVSLLCSDAGWTKVKRSDRKIGWVQSDAVERIVNW